MLEVDPEHEDGFCSHGDPSLYPVQDYETKNNVDMNYTANFLVVKDMTFICFPKPATE